MAKKATKKAVEQLPKIFDFLGEFGGTIETKQPNNWWTLDLEVEEADDVSKDIMIGACKSLEGDIIYDPKFTLTLKMDGDKIVEAEIHSCINQNVFGTTEIDSDDMIHGSGRVEKSPKGLRTMFSGFMDIMTEIGPYLSDQSKVTKYDKTLSD